MLGTLISGEWPEASRRALPGARFQACSVARRSGKFRGFKDQLVEEYAALRGLQLPPVEDAHGRHVLFEAAVQYVHATLLQDLSPPWIGSEFSQALPGDGVLCRYLKPTFLRWDATQVFTKQEREGGNTQRISRMKCKFPNVSRRSAD